MKEIEPQCPYCQKCFIPSRYRPQQRVCSRGECQRRRRSDYHRQKLVSDPEYGLVCRDSRQKWRARNPGYQARYRQTHPEYVSQNRQAQRRRDQKRRLGHLVKNNLALDLKRLEADIWLIGPQGRDLVKNNLAFREVVVFQRVQSSTPALL
ncbi:MAG: hypothetical protein ACE5JP_17155 [Candidatus Bipolaricaulia bacterium]